MTRQKQSKDLLSSYRADIDADDGADAREFFKKGSSKTNNRKSQQLCAQVADTLGQLIGGDTADEILQSLRLIEVSPAPDASQMLVLVGPAAGAPELAAREVLAALNGASGWLRTEIAAAITRKRAPRLIFRYLPAFPSEEGQP